MLKGGQLEVVFVCKHLLQVIEVPHLLCVKVCVEGDGTRIRRLVLALCELLQTDYFLRSCSFALRWLLWPLVRAGLRSSASLRRSLPIREGVLGV